MTKIGRYGHAKQYKRMRKAIKQVKGFLGRVLRDIGRQVKRQGLALTQKQEDTLNQAYRLLKQTRQSKNKLYGLHEPNVDCISKGNFVLIRCGTYSGMELIQALLPRRLENEMAF